MLKRLIATAIAMAMCAAGQVYAAEPAVPPALQAKRSGLKANIPTSLEMVYTPITPCRAFDTTKTTKIPANGSRAFQITGSAGFTGQGGSANGCGVPASASAVTLNLTATNGSAAGLATAAATGAGSSAVYLRFPVSAPTSIQATVALGAQKLTVKTSNTFNVLGDVTGYYAPQIWAYVGGDGVILDKSSRVLSATKLSAGLYELTIDRSVDQCAAVASSDNEPRFVSSYTSETKTYVMIYSSAGVAVDYFFNVHVIC